MDWIIETTYKGSPSVFVTERGDFHPNPNLAKRFNNERAANAWIVLNHFHVNHPWHNFIPVNISVQQESVNEHALIDIVNSNRWHHIGDGTYTSVPKHHTVQAEK